MTGKLRIPTGVLKWQIRENYTVIKQHEEMVHLIEERMGLLQEETLELEKELNKREVIDGPEILQDGSR